MKRPFRFYLAIACYAAWTITLTIDVWFRKPDAGQLIERVEWLAMGCFFMLWAIWDKENKNA